MKIKTTTPDKLPLAHLDWEGLADLTGQAHAVLARYGALIDQIKNPKKTLTLLIWQESIASSIPPRSKLPLRKQLAFYSSQNKIMQKVADCKKAFENAMTKETISLSLIRKTHARIQKHSSSPKKEIGHFRDRQNWIGREGCPIEKAFFYPPKAAHVLKYMKELMHYAHYKEKDPLIQLAIFFAQFLVIHPFMDGNGRVARILIPLIMKKKGLLSIPLFFMSAYFRKHRMLYFSRLYNISARNDWEGWIQFFFAGLIERGKIETLKLKKIHSLYEKIYCKLLTINSKKAKIATETIFEKPIFTVDEFAKKLRIPKQLALKMAAKLQRAKLLKLKKFGEKEALECERLLKFVGK